MTNRRSFLKILGGGFIVAAGGAGAFLGTRTPTKALAPWNSAGDYSEPRMRSLSYAILAPNPHNRQPWMVDLSIPNQITIWRDKSKNLPHTDPFDRQLTIGMGCFLEQLTIAASQTGDVVVFDLFPDGEDGPVAIAQFAEGAFPDPLFNAIPKRRSCKEAFDKRLPTITPELEALAEFHTENSTVEKIRRITINAWKVEAKTHRTMKESTDLFRLGKAEIEENPDGIDFSGPFYESLILAGLLTREGSLDPTSMEFAEASKIYTAMLSATPAYAVIRTAANDRKTQIEAGRKWLRLNLTTTSLGLSLHPVSQALQEYPEMSQHYKEIHEIAANEGETIQMLGRLGYGPEVSASPRWPIEKKLMNG